MYDVRILADSISPRGVRLVTFMVTIPRSVLSEMNTHRDFSRNSASTRAVPVIDQIKNQLETPFVPEAFGVNKKGMQHEEVLSGRRLEMAEAAWQAGRDRNLTTALELILGPEIMSGLFSYDPASGFVSGEKIQAKIDILEDIIPTSTDQRLALELNMPNVHKQLAGRRLEPDMWQVVIISATEFDNFFGLRVHEDAQAEISKPARMMRDAYQTSTPSLVGEGQWHLPLVSPEEFEKMNDLEQALKSSIARVAAVSYRRHQVAFDPSESDDVWRKRLDREASRHDDHLENRHMSPFEHQATPFTAGEQAFRDRLVEIGKLEAKSYDVDEHHVEGVLDRLDFNGNFRGWTQRRKQIPGERVFKGW